ncbi:unnamed protein product [Caenorhabditis bovis]|uniref:Uncharacterized protein n=1 Tax=Caenorhabditis bovis TaxID=2654633 RepID=A0A8S1ERC3_9PELO|nr:unnamed protein product [Caenorhabditis bovis]
MSYPITEPGFAIVLSILGLISGGIQIFNEEDNSMKIPHFLGIGINVIALLGAVHNSPFPLRIIVWLTLINVVIEFLLILILPVLMSSQIASGYTEGLAFLTPKMKELNAEKFNDQERFFMGMTMGYSVEIAFAFAMLIGIMQYVLFNRLYMYAKYLSENGLESKQSMA